MIIVSILLYNFIDFIDILFLVISFDRYKRYMIWKISLRKVADVLPAFTFAKAIGNLCSIGLGVNIFESSNFLLFIKIKDFFQEYCLLFWEK